MTATRNVITQNASDGLFVFGPDINGGPGTAMIANDNTFSTNGGDMRSTRAARAS